MENRLDVAAADPTTPSSGPDHQSKKVNQRVRTRAPSPQFLSGHSHRQDPKAIG